MEKRQISLAEDFQMNYADTLLSMGESRNPLSFHVGLSSKEYSKEKQQKRRIWQWKTWHAFPVRWPRSTSTVINYVAYVYPRYSAMKMEFYLCDFPAPNPGPSLIMRKTADESHLRRVLQNTWPILLKTVRAKQNKESVKNFHSREVPKELWQINVMWHLGQDPGKALGQTKDIWMKYGLLLG